MLALASTANATAPAGRSLTHAHRRPLFLLHGSFVGGWVWHYPGPHATAGVAGLLTDAGFDVHTPTLPGHDAPTHANPRYTPARASVTTAECVDALVDYVTAHTQQTGRHGGEGAIVVAHSYGGVYLSELLARLPPGTITTAIWANAWVLTPGESFVSCALTGWVDRLLARVPVNRFSPSHPISRVEAAFARRLYFNDADPDKAASMAADVYARSVYEAMGPAFDPHALPGFKKAVTRRHAPTLAYIHFDADATGDDAQWLGFAKRLEEASGVALRIATVAGGGHVSMVTRPAAVAAAILEVVAGGQRDEAIDL